MSDPYFARSRVWKAAINVDQAEASAIRSGSATLDAGLTDEGIAGTLDEEFPAPAAPVPVEDWARGDAVREEASSASVEEARRRSRLMGSSYPFELQGAALKYRPTSSLLYEFLLATSLQSDLSRAPWNRLPVAFERIARDALAAYFRAESFRTGWPSDSHETRPTRFKLLAEELGERTGEFNWDPEDGLPDDPPPNRGPKDEGMDFVLWRRAADGRAGMFMALGQCACGDDYRKKYGDLDLEKLGRWMRPLTLVTPMRLFAVPNHIPDELTFREANRLAGLTFDRARLLMTVTSVSSAFADEIRQHAKEPIDELIRLVWDDFEAEC